MTIYRGTIFDTTGNPFVDDPTSVLTHDADGALVVRDGAIIARGPYETMSAEHADEEVVDLRGGVLLPGFVDTHVHYPQIRIIGGLRPAAAGLAADHRDAGGDQARRPGVRHGRGRESSCTGW